MANKASTTAAKAKATTTKAKETANTAASTKAAQTSNANTPPAAPPDPAQATQPAATSEPAPATPTAATPKATEANTEKPKFEPEMVLRITAKTPLGFRRCGVRHPAQATDYPAGKFSADEVKTLKADPNLVVEDL